uniref:voltage-dependent calcium channel gamma-2 subunit-like n=1 Tax=Myxine glutinosa TaxID=7769 RepID=UPI00358E5501
MGVCERGVQLLLTTGGAFATFALMSVAVGTDFWLYSRGTCRSKGGGGDNETSTKNEEVMTHSGLWRTCCLEGTRKGYCKIIDHFPENTDFDSAEYLLRMVRASSIFPILSVTLLLFGGLSIAASRLYKSKNNIILTAGIFFVSAGLSNIIGIIVYISASTGDPNQGQSKKNNYSYGWSFYFGALSFILAEIVGVLAVRIYIENHRLERARLRPNFLKKSTIARLPNYIYHYRRRSNSSSQSTDQSHSHNTSPVARKVYGGMAVAGPQNPADISMYTLSRESSTKTSFGLSCPPPSFLNSGVERRTGEPSFLHMHNCIHKDIADSHAANRRTTPV